MATERGELELERAHLHANSINAIENVWPGQRPLRPLMSMLACIGYVLCDILEMLEKEAE